MFNELIGVGFQWYGLRQANYNKKCSCQALDGSAAPYNCKRCFNTGYLFTDYLIKAYMWQAVLGVEFSSSVGKISTQQKHLVAIHNRPINKFDFVLDLDSDPDTGEIRQPFKVMRAYMVQDSLPVRGDGGRIEFWKCSVEERTFDDGRPGDLGTSYNYGGNRSNDEPS